MAKAPGTTERWPALPYEAGRGTLATLQMWLQIVGKLRVAYVPWVNHQWHVTLHLTSRGLTSRPIPFRGSTFQIDFDFVDHRLLITHGEGGEGAVALKARSVADFYRDLFEKLKALGIPASIHGTPNEVPDPIPFHRNERDGEYDSEFANRWWRVLRSSGLVMEDFRGDFIGKSSPVHFFWGAMDLAVTRFSGKKAPEHPGGIPHLPDRVTREAYSHEVSSVGFWAGGDTNPHPIFYAYAYPSPPGFSEAKVTPEAAHWHSELMEFVLPYDAVRRAASPDDALRTFLDSTYAAAAELGGWDRNALEWAPGTRPPTGGVGDGP